MKSPFKNTSPAHCVHETAKEEVGKGETSLALLLSSGSDSEAGLARGFEPYNSSEYILGMRGSAFVSFADSIS